MPLAISGNTKCNFTINRQMFTIYTFVITENTNKTKRCKGFIDFYCLVETDCENIYFCDMNF